jgi:ceramide glucosyltransferase
MLAFAIEIITTALTFAGLIYYLLALWSARDFMSGRSQRPSLFHPPVSILKPVKGLDPQMYASFASHCRQDYFSEYEILFGVSSMDDPAVAAVKQLQTEFPQSDIRLILCPETRGPNGKVSNLSQILPHARYDYLLINDSDIQVAPQYLSKIMAGFEKPMKAGGRVGMVTAAYRGQASQTIGSRMEALGISTDFIAGVLTARKIEGGIHFGLGSTLAILREALDAIGGFLPLVDYLADDFELGFRTAQAGYEVVLSAEVVDTHLPAYSFPQFLAHQLRWSRAIRDSRKQYFGLLFTFGLPLAIANLIASGMSLPSVALFSMVLAARVALALTVGVAVLRDGQVLRDLWLLLPRDICALGIWAWSYAGHTILWRGEQFSLNKGKLVRVGISGNRAS